MANGKLDLNKDLKFGTLNAIEDVMELLFIKNKSRPLDMQTAHPSLRHTLHHNPWRPQVGNPPVVRIKKRLLPAISSPILGGPIPFIRFMFQSWSRVPLLRASQTQYCILILTLCLPQAVPT